MHIHLADLRRLGRRPNEDVADAVTGAACLGRRRGSARDRAIVAPAVIAWYTRRLASPSSAGLVSRSMTMGETTVDPRHLVARIARPSPNTSSSRAQRPRDRRAGATPAAARMPAIAPRAESLPGS